LDLSKNKKVYIIAGNHDYIKGHFIFQEAKKALDLANTNLKIISLPTLAKIEDKKVLFFPFFSQIVEEDNFSQVDKLLKKTDHSYIHILNEIFLKAYKNWQEDDKNLKIS